MHNTKLWDGLEKRYGIPFPHDYREAAEADCRGDHSEIQSEIQSFVRDQMKWFRLMQFVPERDRRQSQDPPKRRYPASVRKRAYLIEFVIDQNQTDAKPTRRLCSKQAQHRRPRIAWEVTAQKWNETHPNDAKTVSALKTDFYRSLKDDESLQALFDRRAEAFAFRAKEAFTPLLEDLVRANESKFNDTQAALDYAVRALESRLEQASQSMHHYRDVLQRYENLAESDYIAFTTRWRAQLPPLALPTDVADSDWEAMRSELDRIEGRTNHRAADSREGSER